MSESNNMHHTVLQRLEFLHGAIMTATNNVEKVLETVLRDAVVWQPGSDQCPAILTKQGLVDITNIKDNLRSMSAYYEDQVTRYKAVVGAAPSPAEEAAASSGAAPAPVNVDEAIARLREQTAQAALASRRPEPVEAHNPTPVVDLTPEAPVRRIPAVAPDTMPDGTPTVSGARAAAAAQLADAMSALDTTLSPEAKLAQRRVELSRLDESDAGSSSGAAAVLSSPMDLSLAATAGGLPPVKSMDPQPPVARPPQNSLAILFGEASPLLDIFAAGPWLPNGRGLITVGSEGFQWYKRANPLQLAAEAKAGLPSGFFAEMDGLPACVVLRLKSTIVVWTFKLDPEAVAVYMVGLSDQDPAQPRWFSPTQLTATYTARLVKELSDFAMGAQAIK